MGRVAAGTIRMSSSLGAAITRRRVFEPVEAKILVAFSMLLLGLAILFWRWPKALVYPAIVLLAWSGLSVLYRAAALYRRKLKAVPSRADGERLKQST